MWLPAGHLAFAGQASGRLTFTSRATWPFRPRPALPGPAPGSGVDLSIVPPPAIVVRFFVGSRFTDPYQARVTELGDQP